MAAPSRTVNMIIVACMWYMFIIYNIGATEWRKYRLAHCCWKCQLYTHLGRLGRLRFVSSISSPIITHLCEIHKDVCGLSSVVHDP